MEQYPHTGFFHYTAGHFAAVWNACAAIATQGRPVSAIAEQAEVLFYINQPGWNTRLEEIIDGDIQTLSGQLSHNNLCIETPPLLHPAFATTVAAVLGITEQEVYSILHFETAYINGKLSAIGTEEKMKQSGPAHIQALLSAKGNIEVNGLAVDAGKLLITKIPVLPLALRPFISNTFQPAYPGVDNLCYQLLAKFSRNLAGEDTGSSIFNIQAYRLLGQYLRQLVVAVEFGLQQNEWAVMRMLQQLNGKSAPPPATGEIIEPEGYRIPQYRDAHSDISTAVPVDMIVVSDDTVTVQYRDAVVIQHIDTGKELLRLETRPFKIHAVDIAEQLVLFFGCQYEDKYLPTDFFGYDMAKKEWVQVLADKYHYVELAHDTEKRQLVDYRTHTVVAIDDLADYIARKIHSACGNYMWIEDKFGNGGLYNIASALRVLASEHLYRIPADELPLLEIKEFNTGEAAAEMLKQEQRANRFECGAVVVYNGGTMVLNGEFLYHNGLPVLELVLPYSCAAFNKTATQLYLGGSPGIAIINIAELLNNNETTYRFIPNTKGS